MTTRKLRGRRQVQLVLLALAILILLVMLALFLAWWTVIHVPGQSHQGELPPLSSAQQSLQQQLQADVEHLALEIGERNLQCYPELVESARYIEDQLATAGYQVERQEYQVRGLACYNLAAEIAGATRPDEIVLIGAHYDTYLNTPGANDNASGVAALLALARSFAGQPSGRTLRFVAFTNEEPPYFQTPDMGSWVYARRSRQRSENIVAMLSLETIGYYRDQADTQHYPQPLGTFYPDEGNFLAVVGNVGSRKLVHQVLDAFRRQARFPSEGGAAPTSIPGIGWSDHWSFWQEGYPGVMITDTALFRYPYYHHPEDTPDKLDFARMARVVDGLAGVVKELVEG